MLLRMSLQVGLHALVAGQIHSGLQSPSMSQINHLTGMTYLVVDHGPQREAHHDAQTPGPMPKWRKRQDDGQKGLTSHIFLSSFLRLCIRLHCLRTHTMLSVRTWLTD